MGEYIAHISKDGKTIQSLSEHLGNVGIMAEQFAKPMGIGDNAKIAGKLHDVGKQSDAFQSYIRNPSSAKNGGEHSIVGAAQAAKLGMIPTSICISGHHTGLPDFGSRTDGADDATYLGKLARVPKEIPEIPADIKKVPFAFGNSSIENALIIRMLFSCLVDADWIDTSNAMTGSRNYEHNYETLEQLWNKLSRYISGWLTADNPTELNKRRTQILKECITAGKKSVVPDINTLTVPTGGGKTIAAMAYALAAAMADKSIQRIIYVAPYTTILDQNANVYKNVFGEQNVVEHHSGRIYDGNDSFAWRMATENWDAPIIVTTNVQFFESLFASHTSQCRKLHNIANSIVILDEAQQMPINYLTPCIKTLEALKNRCNVRVVLCTATQPALSDRFSSIPQEIVENTEKNEAEFKRCQVTFIENEFTKDSLAEKISTYPTCLCVVNAIRMAKDIYNRVESESKYCLTTNLTPNDRVAMLDEIKGKLAMGTPCIVISTSLIEAGVDIDFPVGFREETSLDSVLQTAGRVNREGKRGLNESSLFVVKVSDSWQPNELKRDCAFLENVKEKFQQVDSHAAVTYFFEQKYGFSDSRLDLKEIEKLSKELAFRTVDESMKIIENDMVTVVINNSANCNMLVDKVRKGIQTRTDVRKLLKYSVSVRRNDFNKMGMHLFEILKSEMPNSYETAEIVCLKDNKMYDKKTGLNIEALKGETNSGIFV